MLSIIVFGFNFQLPPIKGRRPSAIMLKVEEEAARAALLLLLLLKKASAR